MLEKKVNCMVITELEHNAILFSEQFNGYNREKSDVICEWASTCTYNGVERFSGSFLVHIFRKGTFRFDCGVNKYGEYEVTTKKVA